MGLFYTVEDLEYIDVLELDLAAVTPATRARAGVMKNRKYRAKKIQPEIVPFVPKKIQILSAITLRVALTILRAITLRVAPPILSSITLRVALPNPKFQT